MFIKLLQFLNNSKRQCILQIYFFIGKSAKKFLRILKSQKTDYISTSKLPADLNYFWIHKDNINAREVVENTKERLAERKEEPSTNMHAYTQKNSLKRSSSTNRNEAIASTPTKTSPARAPRRPLSSHPLAMAQPRKTQHMARLPIEKTCFLRIFVKKRQENPHLIRKILVV